MENFHNLQIGEDDQMCMGSDDIQDQEGHLDLCLVGRFLAERPIKIQIMNGIMAEVWRSVKGVIIHEIVHQRFLFQFFHEGDLKRVLDGGPWSFDNTYWFCPPYNRVLNQWTSPLYRSIFGFTYMISRRVFSMRGLVRCLIISLVALSNMTRGMVS